MKPKFAILPICFLVIFSSAKAQDIKNMDSAQHQHVKCIVNSPERQGLEGCSILSDRQLVGLTSRTVYWRLERFDSMEVAIKAAGPNSIAMEAHGFIWLVTVETKAEEHVSGHLVALIGPLELPAEGNYIMKVLSTLLMPGSATPIHKHSGPEVFYIINGEQCIERLDTSKHLIAGQSYIIPGNTVHRGRVIGTKPRGALALVLYNSSYPASEDLSDATHLVKCD